jgi:hypothetical protein
MVFARLQVNAGHHVVFIFHQQKSSSGKHRLNLLGIGALAVFKRALYLKRMIDQLCNAGRILGLRFTKLPKHRHQSSFAKKSFIRLSPSSTSA